VKKVEEWVGRGRKNHWENNGLYHRRRRESEEGKNRYKSIVMVIIQE
jgi:hypothetical protein